MSIRNGRLFQESCDKARFDKYEDKRSYVKVHIERAKKITGKYTGITWELNHVLIFIIIMSSFTQLPAEEYVHVHASNDRINTQVALRTSHMPNAENFFNE